MRSYRSKLMENHAISMFFYLLCHKICCIDLPAAKVSQAIIKGTLTLPQNAIYIQYVVVFIYTVVDKL